MERWSGLTADEMQVLETTFWSSGGSRHGLAEVLGFSKSKANALIANLVEQGLLAEHGLRRRVAVCTPTALASLHLVNSSDLVGITALEISRTMLAALELSTFEIPLDLPTLDLSLAWHPRYDADGAHQWLRQCIRDAFSSV